MAMIATLSFLGSLAVILLLGAASYISRGAVRRGGVILALAVALTGLSVAHIYPALKLLHEDSDMASRHAEMDRLLVERDQLRAEIQQRERDNEALSRTSAFFNKLHTERMTRIAEELRNTKEIILGSASGIIAAQPATDSSLTSFIEGPSGFDSIVAELRSLKSLRVRGPDDVIAPTLAVAMAQRSAAADTSGVIVEPSTVKSTRTEGASIATPPPALPGAGAAPKSIDPAPLPAPVKPETETLTALHKALDAKMSTAAYKVELVSDPELVEGRKGRYYVIGLKSPKSGQNFTFDSGKYSLQTSKADYRATFGAFAGDVLKQLEGRVPFEVFVRGSADGQAYSGPYEPGFDIRRISYLPGNGRGKYLANPASVALGSSVRNADLPNLRGEFLRGYLSQIYPGKPVTLLEGQVTKQDNPAARNTELILFVAW